MRASTRWGSMLGIAMGWIAFGVVQAAEPAPAKAPAPSASRQAYDACFKQADERKLDGKVRVEFMTKCMNVKPPSGAVYN